MTNEELDEARVDEAWRVAAREGHSKISMVAARLAREGWKPPEPVDPDVLAYREWDLSQLWSTDHREAVLAGKWDHSVSAIAYLAGARMARAQEQERAQVLVEYVRRQARVTRPAAEALTAYEAGRAAR